MEKVAIQGNAGSYQEIAALEYFGEQEIQLVNCSTFRDIFKDMEEDGSLIDFLAIENTIAGSLLQNYELLRESGMQVIGEYKLRVSPIIGREWEYLFYIDVTFTEYLRYRQALDAILPLTNELMDLGEYASFERIITWKS